ncbi:MAG TPA: glycoside hydrolase family 38 C-terminal domain-containing protein [Anaerolineaceae bacterium]
MTPRSVHYVLSTHWDREWYQTFQDYRHRLVKLIDHLIEGWTDGRLRGPFQTDGQAIILEDYLEVRPERRSLVETLVREGKIVVGPWYVLPDEFIVSGEALIRNLALGRSLARRLGGEPSAAGFMCDLFGQNSQMPQIFAGFGITGAMIWRGTNVIDRRLVRWRGADGSVIPAVRFGKVGYCSYAAQVRPVRHNEPIYSAEEQAERLEAYLQEEAEATETSAMLLFDGGDHLEWDPENYAVLAERMDHPDERYAIRHTSLDAFLAEMLPQANQISTLLSGELREPGVYPAEIDQQWVIPGVLSSRVWIKQWNARCQALLCCLAEPLNTWASLAAGSEYPQGYLDVAWKWLLQNHPHDSICGCSIDAVHEDMRFRFHQAEGIADRITIEAMRALAANIPGSLEEGELRVVVYNPLPRPFVQTAEITLQIPKDYPTFNEFFGYEPKPAFRVYDANGIELPYQRLSQAMNRQHVRTFATIFPQGYQSHEVRISLPLRIPAMGYTTLTVRPGEPGLPTRHPAVPGMATSEASMTNGVLDVKIEPNGSLTVTDLRSGQVYTRWLTFEDTADIGDGWYYGQAVNDQAYSSTACQASVALVHNGPHLTTFRIRTVMSLPEAFDFASMTRSENRKDLVIDSLVSLRPGSDRLEVETTVQNEVSDHRLRLLLPSGARTMSYLSDTPFDVVERPIALSEENHLNRELEVETKPQQSWSALFDGKRGVAVVAFGLHECAVRDLPDRPLALTLFRGTRRTVLTNGEPLGQLHGELKFQYWIIPLSEEPDRASLCEQGMLLEAGLRSLQVHPDDRLSQPGVQPLPKEAGFLRLSGPAVLTSLLQMHRGVQVRLFNPNTRAVGARLDLSGYPGKPPALIQPVNLEGEPVGDPIAIQGGGAVLSLKPKQILTIVIEQSS